MATTLDLRDDDPLLPAVGFRIDGALGTPIIIVPGAIRRRTMPSHSPTVFSAAARPANRLATSPSPGTPEPFTRPQGSSATA